jgi:haloalkane dehalogenase
MSHVFIELYGYKRPWRNLPVDERKTFVTNISAALASISVAGIEVVGWGFNELDIDHRAEYDFFCIYKASSNEPLAQFRANIEASGWYGYFDQVNVSGALVSPETVLEANVLVKRS